MRYYCTYFDRNYLTRAIVLVESLVRHEEQPFRLYAVCMDEISRVLLGKAALPNVVPVPIHDIERGDEELAAVKPTRSLVEYYWTMTPTIILRLLERHAEIDVLTYVDADLFFFSSPQPIFDEIGDRSVLIHPHRFSPAQAQLARHNGTYNVGLLCFRRDENGLEVVRWWRARCLEWCYAQYEDGKLGDQMYLNDWPTRFSGVVELRHIGGGVGPWNHDQYGLDADCRGGVHVDGMPIIFYHFHSYALLNPDIALPVKHGHYPLTLALLRLVFVPYTDALLEADARVRGLFSDFSFGFSGESTVAANLTFIARQAKAESLAKKGFPHVRLKLDNRWDAYCSSQVAEIPTTGLSNGESANTPGATSATQPHQPATPPRPSQPHGSQAESTQHDLLEGLRGRPITEHIRTLYVVGAHLYQERDLIDRLFPNLEVICLFEPIPQCLAVLKRLEAVDPRIKVFPYALSDVEGTAEFHVTDNRGESSSLLRMGRHREIFPHVHEVATIRVECRRLAGVMRHHELPAPDMLLLDVQGAEYKVLTGLSDLKEDWPRLLYVEASLEEVYQGAKTLEEVKELLAPRYAFGGFAPLSMECPTHGNALFVKQEDAALLAGAPDAQNPRVSVIVSSYKSAAFIWECLEDLQRQTIADRLEIIVVDAASPENERAVVEAFQQRFGNITYIRTPKRISVYAAWNLALKVATGNYVTPFSTNDRLRPDAYGILSQALDERSDIALVYGDTYLTATPHQSFERHTRIGVWQWPAYSYDDLLRNCRVGPHPMWRRSIHDSLGYFDDSYQALGDQEFWLRLGETHQLLHIPVVTGLYWMSPNGLSNRKEITTAEEQRLHARYRAQPRPSTQIGYEASIIMPVWNRSDLTKQCLSALATATTGASWEIIVVDNGSTDDTPAFLSALGGDVRIIRNAVNLGFAKACNQGARAAKGRNLIFLNNDTIPLDGWLEPLLEEVRTHSDVAVVGSKLLYPDGKVQHAGVAFSRQFLTPYYVYQGTPGESPVVNYRRELQAVAAACLLIRRDCFDAAGGFDEHYRNGFEDADLCMKIRSGGHKIVYQPRSVLIHYQSQTPGRNDYDAENAARFRAQWSARVVEDEDIIYGSDGLALRDRGGSDKQRQVVEPLVDDRDKMEWAHVAAAQQFARGGDTKALASVLALVKEWPEDPSVLIWAARLCRRVDLPALADPFWRRVLQLRECEDARAALAGAALDSGSLQEAGDHIRRLLEVDPKHGEGRLLQGILAMQEERWGDAAEAFAYAHAYGDQPRKSMLGLVMAHVARREYARAWKVCHQLSGAYPDDAEILHWVIRVGTALEEWAALEVHLLEFVRRNPGDCGARFALAGILVRNGKAEAARREHRRLSMLAPQYDGLNELTRAIEQASEKLEAIPLNR